MYSITKMDTEQRLVILESDMKEAKERIGRHSGRLNTLEQNLLEEKGEMAKLKSEVSVMDARLESVQREQELMNEKLDTTNEKLDNLEDKIRKYIIRFGIVIVMVLIAIFVKDSSTGSQISAILSILRP